MKILVAGIGNIFLGDDGFGVEVATRLAAEPVPDGVSVGEYGIRGMHLAYELMSGYDVTILIDATARGEVPGTVTVLELDTTAPAEPPPVSAHEMTPDSVLDFVHLLGGTPGRVLLVGCEPASLDPGIGLSEPVAAAVTPAAAEVHALVAELLVPAGKGV
ncbi:MAG TPA: hydrogenase maturation protease [Actinokineospora sp.]|jgi:hydrogenase maturation protease|nr:hydrogenase maturation protease [Actinokineospora sp.]